MITLESTEWDELTDAYGVATGIPKLLRLLSDFPVGLDYKDEPWFSLWGALCHQGDVYPASFAAVPFIVAAIERDPSRASFNFFALPASIEVARNENKVLIPKSLEAEYFKVLAKLPTLALPLLRPHCDKTLCQALLSAIAAAVGQHDYAKLLLEIDSDSIPETLEWFYER
jgi:hypothetical protein